MTAPSKSFCSVCSKAAGLRTSGTAWATSLFLIVELPLPWPEDPMDARSVPPGTPETLRALWNDEIPVGVFAIAPDPAYSVPNRTRIMAFDFAAGDGGAAVRADYLAPVDLVAATMDALARKQPLPDGIAVDSHPYRDAMICTHGSRDACCATFGFPLYRSLRSLGEHDPDLRIWRATHFGGHRFAPTMMTFPDGRSWGYLDQATGRSILTRTESVDSLAGVYRGWSGYTDDALQLVEQEIFLRLGWSWLDYRQHGRVISTDSVTGTKSIEIDAVAPTGERVTFSARVEPVDPISAMASCGDEAYLTPSFRVVGFMQRVSLDALSAGISV